MATIEGKPAAEWFKASAQRQKRSNAFAKYEEPAKPEPARQVAAAPKTQSYVSAPKPEPAKATEAKKAEPVKVAEKPKSAQEEHQERIKAANQMISETLSKLRPKAEQDKEIADLKAKDTAKQEAEAKAYKDAQRRLDEKAATPGMVGVASGVGKAGAAITGGIAKAAKAAAKETGRQYSVLGSYAGSQARKSYRWLTGDPDAKRRLQAGK